MTTKHYPLMTITELEIEDGLIRANLRYLIWSLNAAKQQGDTLRAEDIIEEINQLNENQAAIAKELNSRLDRKNTKKAAI